MAVANSLLDLSAMPPVVNLILEHLTMRDVKALRLTCSETRRWVESAPRFIKRSWGRVSTTINMDLRRRKMTFHTLALVPFVVDELKLINYNSPRRLDFGVTGCYLRTQGPGLKTLRMDNFFGCRHDEELKFLEGLVNLKKLSVGNLDFNTKFAQLEEKPSRFKGVLQNLECINLESHSNINCNRADRSEINEFLCSPKLTTVLKLLHYPNGGLFSESAREFLERNLAELAKRRESSLLPGGGKNYTHVDLGALEQALPMLPIPSLQLSRFLVHCRENGIRVLNAPSRLLAEYSLFFMDNDVVENQIERTVESFVGWHWSIKSNTARELTIPSTRVGYYNNFPVHVIVDNLEDAVMRYPIEPVAHCPFPNLETLRVKFNTCFETVSPFQCIKLIRALHLGPTTGRDVNCGSHGVTTLELSFSRSWLDDGETETPAWIICPPTITQFYPNIKDLRLTAWDADDNLWTLLWTGLNHLEELYIDDCRNLTDNCFFGGEMHANEHVFFKYKNTLKKMTLKLNAKTKLSHTFFRDILAHMPLEEFYLHTTKIHRLSDRILDRKAIDYLAEGVFGKSVKKFPFDTFNLKNTYAKELNELKYKFPNAHV